MNGWTITKVFRVNGKLTVARTIEEAIALYRKYAAPNTVDVRSVEQVTTANSILFRQTGNYKNILKKTDV